MCPLGNVDVPFQHFLVEQPLQLEAATARDRTPTGSENKRVIKDIPLVMRLLLQESEEVNNDLEHPEGSKFMSLARSIRPNNFREGKSFLEWYSIMFTQNPGRAKFFVDSLA